MKKQKYNLDEIFREVEIAAKKEGIDTESADFKIKFLKARQTLQEKIAEADNEENKQAKMALLIQVKKTIKELSDIKSKKVSWTDVKGRPDIPQPEDPKEKIDMAMNPIWDTIGRQQKEIEETNKKLGNIKPPKELPKENLESRITPDMMRKIVYLTSDQFYQNIQSFIDGSVPRIVDIAGLTQNDADGRYLQTVSHDTTLTGDGTAAHPLSATAVSENYKTAITAADTTPNYLVSKVLAGTGITVTKENAGANEDLKIATTITQYTDAMAVAAVGTPWTGMGYLTKALADTYYYPLFTNPAGYWHTASTDYNILVNSTSTQKFLSQTSSGTPSWQVLPAQGQFTYYLQHTNSGVATYEKLLPAPYTPKTTENYTPGDGTHVLKNYITEPGIPNLTFIPAGSFEFHIHASLSGSGASTAEVYAEFWETNSSGADIAKIGTTETSVALVTSESEYRLFFVNANSYNMVSSASRIVCRVYAITTHSASVQLIMGDEADSHIALPSVTVDATNFVPYTGATATLDMGSHDINIASGQHYKINNVNLAYSDVGAQIAGTYVAATNGGLVVPNTAGNNGKVLGLTSGALDWVSGGGSGGPGGNIYAVQFNDGSRNFAGTDEFQFNSTTNTLLLGVSTQGTLSFGNYPITLIATGVGNGDIKIGQGAISGGSGAIAIGYNAIANPASITIGGGSNASGDYGVVVGTGASVDEDSVSVGALSVTGGHGSTSTHKETAVGYNSSAYGASTALGANAIAYGNGIAIGTADSSPALAYLFSIAIGTQSCAGNPGMNLGNCIAIGCQATANYNDCMALGGGSTAAYQYSFALGNYVSTTQDYQFAIGGWNPNASAGQTWISITPDAFHSFVHMQLPYLPTGAGSPPAGTATGDIWLDTNTNYLAVVP